MVITVLDDKKNKAPEILMWRGFKKLKYAKLKKHCN